MNNSITHRLMHPTWLLEKTRRLVSRTVSLDSWRSIKYWKARCRLEIQSWSQAGPLDCRGWSRLDLNQVFFSTASAMLTTKPITMCETPFSFKHPFKWNFLVGLPWSSGAEPNTHAVVLARTICVVLDPVDAAIPFLLDDSHHRSCRTNLLRIQSVLLRSCEQHHMNI